MIRRFCDLCGSQVDVNIKPPYTITDHTKHHLELDLCAACQYQLAAWVTKTIYNE